MPTQPPVLSGERCRCQSCGRYFNSAHAFDIHRVIVTYAPNYSRRCMNDAEIAAAGLEPNPAGFLRQPMASSANPWSRNPPEPPL